VEISVSDQGGAERAGGAAPGLGLWIAARLAEAMEGGLEAVALPDGGKRVRVWIGAA
jgi:signal transduction histidine kinase